MLNISPFGMFHTLLGLAAVVFGFLALFRRGEIAYADRRGRMFVWLTIGTCVTGFFIFRHGGFGKPHMLGILTLVVLAFAYAAERRAAVAVWARYASAAMYTLTLFFHFIPGFTETLIRVPVAAPFASGPDDPKLAAIIGIVFALFLIGMAVQALRIRTRLRTDGGRMAAAAAINLPP